MIKIWNPGNNKRIFTMPSVNFVFIFIGCHVFLVDGFFSTASPEEYVVNLDLPATDRWAKIVPKYKVSILTVEKEILSKFPVLETILPLVEKITADIDNVLPQPFADEMKGMAKALDMPLGLIVGANILYDLTAFCTSIVAQDINNTIWHGRNLDYSLESLRDMTIVVDFQRNGTTLYKGVTFAGYVGLMTGQRPNAFSISVDERDQGSVIENALVFLLDHKAPPVSFLLRQTLEKEQTFQTAVKRLSSTVTIAGVYFIVSGTKPGEGVIITKDRLSAVDVYYIQSPSRWFLVETNYDHWVSPPPSDDRRDPAIKMMNTIGQHHINNDTLFDVLSTGPVLNNHTIYTCLIGAAHPKLFRAWIRK